jgi:hypothetical protein
LRLDPSGPAGAGPLVEADRVGIGHDDDAVGAGSSRRIDDGCQQRAADPATHPGRIDPQTLELGVTMVDPDRGEAGDLLVQLRDKDLLGLEAVRAPGEVVAPQGDPLLGIGPVALGRVGDGRELAALLHAGRADRHGGHRPESVTGRAAGPAPGRWWMAALSRRGL